MAPIIWFIWSSRLVAELFIPQHLVFVPASFEEVPVQTVYAGILRTKRTIKFGAIYYLLSQSQYGI